MAATTTWSSGDRGEGILPPTTSWTVSSGSLRDTICVETSESVLADVSEEGAVCVPGKLVLSKPADRESDPCEITLCFREKREIHRVYVRSTARVFEIYYGAEKDEDHEYLCTVRCGPAEKEAIHPDHSSSFPEIPEKRSNASSEEDGWIEIKAPETKDSPMYFEATAEISDFSPCMCLKFRLLSLQSKERVEIEEIYVYADQVDSTDASIPSKKSEDISGYPLMNMLVPSLLQLSKAGGFNAKERGNEIKPETAKSRIQEHEHKNVVAENSSCLEKKLDELIFRVARMESFISRFEASIMNPLSSIDSRLQRVELQLDAISSRTEFQIKTLDSDESPPSSGIGSETQTVDCAGKVKECAGHDDVNPVLHDADGDSSLSHTIFPDFVEAKTGRVEECDEHDDVSPVLHDADDDSSVYHSPCPDVTEVKASLSIDDAMNLALKAFILSDSALPHENQADSTGMETQVEEIILEPTPVQRDDDDNDDDDSPNIMASVYVVADANQGSQELKTNQDDHEFGTDGERDADISDNPISFEIDKAVDHSKEEAEETLKAFLSGLFQKDDQYLSRTSQEESILDVKFTKHEESSGVDYLGTDPAVSEHQNEHVSLQDSNLDSLETFLLDLEVAAEDAGADRTTPQLLVSLI